MESIINNFGYHMVICVNRALPIEETKQKWDYRTGEMKSVPTGNRLHCFKFNDKLYFSMELYKRMLNEFGIQNTLPLESVYGDEISAEDRIGDKETHCTGE